MRGNKKRQLFLFDIYREQIGGVIKSTKRYKSELITRHTGRSTWISICRQLEVPENIIDMVTGHVNESMQSRYDRRESELKAKVLVPYLEKIETLINGGGAKEIRI